MAYGFVRQSGGHITIDSEPGAGTEISLHLPRAHSTRKKVPHRMTRICCEVGANIFWLSRMMMKCARSSLSPSRVSATR